MYEGRTKTIDIDKSGILNNRCFLLISVKCNLNLRHLSNVERVTKSEGMINWFMQNVNLFYGQFVKIKSYKLTCTTIN